MCTNKVAPGQIRFPLSVIAQHHSLVDIRTLEVAGYLKVSANNIHESRVGRAAATSNSNQDEQPTVHSLPCGDVSGRRLSAQLLYTCDWFGMACRYCYFCSDILTCFSRGRSPMVKISADSPSKNLSCESVCLSDVLSLSLSVC